MLTSMRFLGRNIQSEKIMKKFICPIDDRIKISLPDEFPMTQVIYSNGVGVEFSIANCKTPLPNSACKMIYMGCIGCHFNKEEILKKMFHELWIVFKRPFSAHEIQTCENILRDFDTSKLTTEKPELFWGRFFVSDSSGWVTRDEAEESAEELCGLINITVNIQYEFEER